jgi:hypothetical protein
MQHQHMLGCCLLLIYVSFIDGAFALTSGAPLLLCSCRNPGSMGKQYFVGLEKVMGGSGDPAYPGKCESTRVYGNLG